ncbi:MAG: helix-turn-helix domain-containing protein [Lentisphaeria bacterium]|nr:helix-turn-helix domain-containing protein [Lentisphaeria bacterium]
MKNDLPEIAPRLRMIRNLLRIPQHEFARRLKISLSHYSKLEAGIGGISEALLLAVAAEAQVTPEWLKTGTGTAPQITANKQKQSRTAALTLDQIEQIIRFTENEEIRRLAEKMSHTAGIPLVRSLAALAREALQSTTRA